MKISYGVNVLLGILVLLLIYFEYEKRNKIKDAEKMIKKYEEEYKILNSKETEIKKKLRENEAKIIELTKSLKDGKKISVFIDKNRILTDENKILIDKNKILVGENKKLGTDNKNLKNNIDTLTKNFENLENTYGNLEFANNNLNISHLQLIEKYNKLEINISELKKTNLIIEKTIKSKEIEIEDKKKELENYKIKLSDLSKNQNNIIKENTAHNKNINIKNAEIIKLNSEIEQLKSEIEQLKKQHINNHINIGVNLKKQEENIERQKEDNAIDRIQNIINNTLGKQDVKYFSPKNYDPSGSLKTFIYILKNINNKENPIHIFYHKNMLSYDDNNKFLIQNIVAHSDIIDNKGIYGVITRDRCRFYSSIDFFRPLFRPDFFNNLSRKIHDETSDNDHQDSIDNGLDFIIENCSEFVPNHTEKNLGSFTCSNSKHSGANPKDTNVAGIAKQYININFSSFPDINDVITGLLSPNGYVQIKTSNCETCSKNNMAEKMLPDKPAIYNEYKITNKNKYFVINLTYDLLYNISNIPKKIENHNYYLASLIVRQANFNVNNGNPEETSGHFYTYCYDRQNNKWYRYYYDKISSVDENYMQLIFDYGFDLTKYNSVCTLLYCKIINK